MAASIFTFGGGAGAGAAEGRANLTTPDRGIAPGPGARSKFRPLYIRRAGRRAKRRGPVEDLPVAFSAGVRKWAEGSTERLLTVGSVLNCGRTGEKYGCTWNPRHFSFSPCRCSETALCPGCARKDTDKAALSAAADFEAVVNGIRDLRQVGQAARDRLTHRLALIGVVATVPEWLEKHIRPGNRDEERRLWEAFDRFIKKMLPGTGVFAGVDWFGDGDSRVRPHVDARLLNVRRKAGGGGTKGEEKAGIRGPFTSEGVLPLLPAISAGPEWSTFATKRKGCIKHARRRWWEKPKPLNARTCAISAPCEVHGLHQAWTEALRATFEKHLPPAELNEVRDWNAVINWHFDPLESKGSRHAPKLAKDWDSVIAARCSYSAKPPVEVVTKWSDLNREEGGDGIPPASTFDALWAVRGDAKEKGIRRIRRFGWLAPSVRRARLLELRQEVEPLSRVEKVVPICGVDGCFGRGEGMGDRIGIAEARAARMPLLRWLRPDELPPAPPRAPPKYEPADLVKRKKEYVEIAGKLFSHRVRVEKMEPDEGVEPWVCLRCFAKLKVKARPRYCWRDLGGCGRHESVTRFARARWSIGIELPYEWWIGEYRAVLNASTIEEMDTHDAGHRTLAGPGDTFDRLISSAPRILAATEGCKLCAVERVKPRGATG